MCDLYTQLLCSHCVVNYIQNSCVYMQLVEILLFAIDSNQTLDLWDLVWNYIFHILILSLKLDNCNLLFLFTICWTLICLYNLEQKHVPSLRICKSLAELRYNVTMLFQPVSETWSLLDILLRISLQLLRNTECQWPPK